jgi:flagellar hook-length control protein FliK
MLDGNRPPTTPVESHVRSDLPAAGAVATTPNVTPVNAATSTVSINTPLGQAGWDQVLGERIQWLAGQKVQAAQVKLNPANLGPLEVRVQVHNDQASVQFTAQHAVVREALEAALPRLRDMFETSGVQLVDVDVSSGESFAEQQRAMQHSENSQNSHGHGSDEAVSETRLETPLAAFVAPGRLDLFA